MAAGPRAAGGARPGQLPRRGLRARPPPGAGSLPPPGERRRDRHLGVSACSSQRCEPRFPLGSLKKQRGVGQARAPLSFPSPPLRSLPPHRRRGGGIRAAVPAARAASSPLPGPGSAAARLCCGPEPGAARHCAGGGRRRRAPGTCSPAAMQSRGHGAPARVLSSAPTEAAFRRSISDVGLLLGGAGKNRARSGHFTLRGTDGHRSLGCIQTDAALLPQLLYKEGLGQPCGWKRTVTNRVWNV